MSNKRKEDVQNQKIAIAGAVGSLVLLVTVVLGFKACGTSEKAAAPAPVTSDAMSGEVTSDSASVAASAPTDTPAPASITLSFVGDVILGKDENFAYDSSMNAYYDSYGADYFLQNVKDIFAKDDLTVINMEGTLTNSNERADKTFAFKADPAYVDILKNSSIEAANVANNHSQDYGDQGFSDTLATLAENGITTFGYDDVAVVDVKGVKVGLVGTYELEQLDGIAPSMEENLQKVRDQGAQIVVAVFHWGIELDTCPDEYQVSLAHDAIDHGADIVIGHHPHILQGIEYYNGKPIMYSLGNFCFGGNTHPTEMDTIILQPKFTVDAAGNITDTSLSIIPCYVSSTGDYNNYQPEILTDDAGDSVLDKINERSQEIADTYGAESVYHSAA